MHDSKCKCNPCAKKWNRTLQSGPIHFAACQEKRRRRLARWGSIHQDARQTQLTRHKCCSMLISQFMPSAFRQNWLISLQFFPCYHFQNFSFSCSITPTADDSITSLLRREVASSYERCFQEQLTPCWKRLLETWIKFLKFYKLTCWRSIKAWQWLLSGSHAEACTRSSQTLASQGFAASASKSL